MGRDQCFFVTLAGDIVTLAEKGSKGPKVMTLFVTLAENKNKTLVHVPVCRLFVVLQTSANHALMRNP